MRKIRVNSEAKKMRYFLSMMLIIALVTSCSQNSSKKIKLAGENYVEGQNQNTTSTIIQVDQNAQHSIAVLHFKNETGRENLAWLTRGLADMLVTELSQSPYFAVIGLNKLYEVATEMGQSAGDLEDLLTASMVAKSARADILLYGSYAEKDNQMQISVEILDVITSQIISKEMISGVGKSAILGMVDELATQVANNIHGKLDEKIDGTIHLSQMTKSIDAFRCYSEALAYYEKFLPLDAEKCLIEAVKFDTTFAVAYLRLAQHYLTYGKRDDAVLAYQRTKIYLDKLSESDKIELDILDKNIKGDYDDIVQILKTAVERFPNNVDLRLRLARHYRSRRNLEKALEHFEIALEKAPSAKLIYNDLGYLFAERGDFSTAIKYFIKYQRLAPDEPNPYDSHGEILLNAGKFQEAITQYKMALEKWPTFYTSALQLSEIYMELADYDNAMKYLSVADGGKTSDRMKGYADARHFKIMWRFGRLEAAEELLRQLLQGKNGTYRFTPIAMEFYRATAQPEKAKKQLQKSLNDFEQVILSEKYDDQIIYSYIGLLLSEDISPEQILPILNFIDGEQLTSRVRGVFYFVSGLMNLRANNYKGAEKVFTSAGSSMLTLLTGNLNIGRSSAWKYVYESLENYASETKPDFSALDSFIKEIQKSEIDYVQNMAILGRARNYEKAGMKKDAREIYQNMGVPEERHWKLYGPYKAQNMSGFDHSFPPEKFVGGHHLTAKLPVDDELDGFVDLKASFPESNWVVGYAEMDLFSPVEQKVQIRLGTDEACKLWLNEEQIWQHYIKKDAVLDRDILSVRLKTGQNKILLKVTNTDFDWGFYFRITDSAGKGVPGIRFGTFPVAGL